MHQTNPDVKPQIDVHRRTTKVNIGVVVGVLAFLTVTVLVILYIARNPKETVEEQHRQIENSNP